MENSRYNEAKELCINAFAAKRTPYVHGSPGTAKSTMFREIAEEYNLLYIPFILTNRDVTMVTGFPRVDATTGRAYFAPLQLFPLECGPDGKPDKLPINPKTNEKYEGWLLHLDELSACAPAVQVAAYGILLDHIVGDYKLHPKCFVAGTGNLITDGAAATKLNTASGTRVVHIKMVGEENITYEQGNSWLDMAEEKKFDHRVISWIMKNPGKLNGVQTSDERTAVKGQFTYTNQRTLHILSDMLKAQELINKKNKKNSKSLFTESVEQCMGKPIETKIAKKSLDILPLSLVEGCIGERDAQQFIAFCKVYKDVPNVDDILKTPELVQFNPTANICIAVIGILSDLFNSETSENIVKFVERMPVEFQVQFMQRIFRRYPEASTDKHTTKWIHNNMDRLKR